MPIKTSSLNIKAFPLEVINKENNEKTWQILSPSSILPTTALFMLHITTETALKLTYKITVKQSNNLMQKSALFYDLSTQYTDYASQSSLRLSDDNTCKDFINDSSLKELTQEADGLPILCIELPNISIEIIDSLLQWLFNNNDTKFDDILTSSLASNIKSTLDFFGLLNFATLLNLNEPYCSIIDEILVWYYFGLSVQERNLKIIKNESFINGNIPARFVKRLAESVDEFEEKQILSNFFRSDDDISKDNDWETLSLTNDDNENISRSNNVLDWLNSSVITPTPRRVTFSLPDSPSPLDTAEPPTPSGSAYFCIPPPPNTPSSPTFKRILPRSLPRTPKTSSFTKSIIVPTLSINEENKLESDDIPLTAGLAVPPNTPNSPLNNLNNLNNLNLLVNMVNKSNNFKMISKSPTLVPPNTPMSPENIIVPPNTPNSSIFSPNSPATSFYSPLAPPNTPNTPFSSCSYHSTITINGLLSPTSPSPIAVPPNTPTSPFIFQSIINNNNNNNNNNLINISSSFNTFNINSNNRRKNSREINVTIDSVLANSLNNLY